MRESCDNCKYKETSPFHHPCNSCFQMISNTMWEMNE